VIDRNQNRHLIAESRYLLERELPYLCIRTVREMDERIGAADSNRVRADQLVEIWS